MLAVSFLSFFFFSIFFIFYSVLFYFYFLFYKNVASKLVNVFDKLEKKMLSFTQKLSAAFCVSLIKYLLGYLLIFFISFKGFSFSFFFKHLSVENFSFNVYFLISLFFFFLIFFFENIFLNARELSAGVDFVFAVSLFFIFGPIAVFANSLLTFFFFLEFGSLLTIFLLVSSREYFCLKHGAQANSYFNSIFFQFWASFFSSILLMYGVINFFFMFGTTEWAFLNFFLQHSTSFSGVLATWQLYYSVYLLVFALFIKMGISPFFFFKIEIYKGLPLVVIFFYSIIYFFFFFVLIFLFFLYYFYAVFFFLTVPSIFFLVVSVVIFSTSLFNFYLLKNFFALSSLVNSIMFFFLLFSYAL